MSTNFRWNFSDIEFMFMEIFLKNYWNVLKVKPRLNFSWDVPAQSSEWIPCLPIPIQWYLHGHMEDWETDGEEKGKAIPVTGRGGP
jgi:hypothetical protein